MKQLIVKFIILLSIPFCASSQQSSLYTQYILDKYQFNPAYGGLEASLQINAAIRSQWNGIPGQPKSQYINAHLPWYVWNGAIGFSLSNETAGALRNVQINGSYNYVLQNSYGIFSFGIQAGLLQKTVDGSIITTPEGDYSDNNFSHNDPAIDIESYSGISPVWTGGFFYTGYNAEGGISISHFPEPTLNTGFSSFDVSTMATLFGSYSINQSPTLEIVPNFMVRTDFVEYQTDFSVMARHNGSIFGSIGLRGYNSSSIDALTFMVGAKVSPRYIIAYSFDTGLSDIKRVNEGSHEVRLMFNLQRTIRTGALPRIIYNPRRL